MSSSRPDTDRDSRDEKPINSDAAVLKEHLSTPPSPPALTAESSSETSAKRSWFSRRKPPDVANVDEKKQEGEKDVGFGLKTDDTPAKQVGFTQLFRYVVLVLSRGQFVQIGRCCVVMAQWSNRLRDFTCVLHLIGILIAAVDLGFRPTLNFPSILLA